MDDIARILVLCEAGIFCDDLAHRAGQLAGRLKSELFLMAVIDNPFGTPGLSFPRPSLKKDYRDLVVKTRKILREMAYREMRFGITVHELIREGSPANEVVSVVEEKSIDLLVLPAHRRTILENLVAGGYNKSLFRRMPCSLLFLKSEPQAVVEEEEGEENGDQEMEAA